jgi:alkylhydroperoxidase/carboxymuconolactone decarboxylase family protein YurZ
VADFKETLRKLAVRDDGYVDRLLGDESANEAASELDGKVHALVRIAALAAIDAAPPSYGAAVSAARQWGATNEEIAGCLIAILPAVGVARIVSAAPKVGLALGYDVDEALESPAGTVLPRDR